MAIISQWNIGQTKIEIDIIYNPNNIAIGLGMGRNEFYKKHAINFFIEFYITFWTIGFELKRRRSE